MFDGYVALVRLCRHVRQVLLKDPSLTFNIRNCVVVRRGEKQVLQYYVDLCDYCLPLFEMQWAQLKKIVTKAENDGTGRFDAYVR
jgi:histone-lysine N-methyltransferase SETD3